MATALPFTDYFQRLVQHVRGTAAPADELTPPDLDVLRTEAVYDGEYLDHYYWELVEHEAGHDYYYHKVVPLVQLEFLPVEQREDIGVLEKMRKALRGLHQDRLDWVALFAGILDPPVGVVQCYGVQARAATYQQARDQALSDLAALQAALQAVYAQSEYTRLPIRTGQWIRQAFQTMHHAGVGIGQPDPRTNPRGLDGRSVFSQQVDELSLQQNEYLFRGMLAAGEEFMAVFLGAAVPVADLVQLQLATAREASRWASMERGTQGINVGLSLPVILSGAVTDGAATSASGSRAHAEGQSTVESQGQAHTVGHAEGVTEGQAHTVGHTQGVTVTDGRGTSTSVADTQGTAHTAGQAHTDSVSDTQGTADTRSWSNSHSEGSSASWGTSQGASQGQSSSLSINQGTSAAVGSSDGVTHTDQAGTSAAVSSNHGVSEGRTLAASLGADVGASLIVSGGLKGSSTVSQSGGENWGTGSTDTVSAGASDAVAHTDSATHGVSQGVGASAGVNSGTSESVSVGGATSVSDTTTRGGAHTASQAHTVGRADTVSQSDSVSTARSQGSGASISHAVSRSAAVSEAVTLSRATSRTTSESDTVSQSKAQGVSVQDSVGLAQARSLVAGRAMGVGVGISPSLSASKSYQWEDHQATAVANLLRTQERLLELMTGEGGCLVHAYLLTRTPRGQRTIKGLYGTAYHGTEDVATPAQVRALSEPEVPYVIRHARSFTPTTRRQRLPGVWERYRDASLLTLLQAAALIAPGVFETGPALTVQPRIPPYAFDPQLPGEAVLGHQYAHETAQLTTAPLRLTRQRLTNTGFFADTRFGKSVAAMRLAVEVNQQWGDRVVVFDFGLGWRVLQQVIPDDCYDFYSLYPGGPRPISWNPLQISARIPAEIQMLATVDLICNAGRMGERQAGWVRQALHKLYLDQGVLTDDPEVVWPDQHSTAVAAARQARALANARSSDAKLEAAAQKAEALARQRRAWAEVQGDERPVLDAARAARGYGPTPARIVRLEELTDWEKQALAVYRSQRVDLAMLHDQLQDYQAGIKRASPTDYSALEGVLKRLWTFRHGAMTRLYGQGAGALPLEGLGWTPDGRGGGVVLEGGATEMDAYAKSLLLALMSWHLYTDAVRQARDVNPDPSRPRTLMIFEEANKIIRGVASSGDKEAGGAPVQTDIFDAMARDAGKYGFVMAYVAQSIGPTQFPPGIVSSCNNLFFGRLKNPEDRDTALPTYGRSERGFHDLEYLKHLGR
ncbi:MAG: serine-rich protein, partial [Chloroflexi bacterium]|nr:serine-rich protein [Chloroflexota bacterium]